MEERVVLDCRKTPSISNCTVTIAGSPEEVVDLAVYHAIRTHGEADSAELREGIRRSFEPEASPLREAAE